MSCILEHILVKVAIGAVCLMLSGCAFGPRSLELSHGKYNQALKHVDDEQLLLNLVRMRYNENPMRLEVSAIAAQYELNASAEARPFFSTESVALGTLANSYRSFSKVLPFAGANVTNRPTISLTPLDDPENLRQFFNPSTLDGIAFLAETSWPVSTVFRLCVNSMNRVPNAHCASGPDTGQMPEFREYQRAMQILQDLQDRGQMRFFREEKLVEVGTALAENAVASANHLEAAKAGLEYQQSVDKTWKLIRRDRRLVLVLDPRVLSEPQVTELCEILHLVPGQTQYEIVLAGTHDAFESQPPQLHRTIAITPRSPVQSFFYVSYGVVVPPCHRQCGLVKSTPGVDWQDLTAGLFTVQSCAGHRRPDCAFVSVKYRDHWYYIDDRDTATKTTFSLISTMSRINLLAARKGGPTLTLPVGR